MCILPQFSRAEFRWRENARSPCLLFDLLEIFFFIVQKTSPKCFITSQLQSSMYNAYDICSISLKKKIGLKIHLSQIITSRFTLCHCTYFYFWIKDMRYLVITYAVSYVF